MRKICLSLFLSLILPTFAFASTVSLDDGTTDQAETYTYTGFIGTANLTVDVKPDDGGNWVYNQNVDVTKNAGQGLGVNYSTGGLFGGGPDNSPALEYGETLVFTFSEQVILSGFTITSNDQPSHYFNVLNRDDDSDIDFTIDPGTGFVGFSGGPMSLLSFAITGLVNCTGLFIESIETPSAVPLPAALPLYAAGMGVLGFLGWRKKRKLSA